MESRLRSGDHTGRMPGQVFNGRLEVGNQKTGQIAADSQANNNPLDDEVYPVCRHGIGRHLPSPHTQTVGEFVKGVAWISSFLDRPTDSRDAVRRIAAEDHLKGTECSNLI